MMDCRKGLRNYPLNIFISDTPISSLTAAMSDLMAGAELPTAAAGKPCFLSFFWKNLLKFFPTAGNLVNSVSQSVSDRESVVTCQLATQEDEFTKIQVRSIIIKENRKEGETVSGTEINHFLKTCSADKGKDNCC